MQEPAPVATTGRYGRRRPRPGLTTAAIVSAGRRVIERDGLDALTMRTVAAELGTAATSLYRHVADRDALLRAIQEQVAAGLPVDVPGRSPHRRLHRRLVAAHDHMARHVWVLHILVRGELVAENAFPFIDACLADFLRAGLDPRQAMAAFRACWHLTVGELLDRHPLRPPGEPTQLQQTLARLDLTRLPSLARVIEQTPHRHHRDEFAHAMDRLLSALLPTVGAEG